ncbi:hypothetical protein BVC80_1835g731 [Macleaya cordata]|uniref:Tify domain-containing protein n=1 Tax=Macleaya cordata TaxID=56857 RepID=A0A200R6G5_MACCD|nr:hypothetical protein BVC80_1835g731 [Macleaya cordata]
MEKGMCDAHVAHLWNRSGPTCSIQPSQSSFQSKDFWMAKGTGCLTDGEMGYDNSSRIEPKRAHQWFLDATEPELFPNKKQAVETSNSRSLSGVPNPNISLWDNASSFQSVPAQFTDNRLFGSEPARNINFGARNIPSIGGGNINMGRRGIEDQFGNDASIALSMSHTMEDPGSCLSYGGIRKVKINQVKDTDNGMSLPIGHTFNKGESTTISFGGFHDEPESNPSGGLISSYDLLMSQSSVQQPEVVKQKELVNSNIDVILSATQVVSPVNETPKNKEQKTAKKVPPNNFPSNVRSLLSTGMLDGVPVKYISWSREKELRGIIKGSGYLCSCQSCNFSKVLNAYEFERHAGCKTKHPNNHIFFENGKTIYAIVQELRSTSQNLLFEAIQTVTGSPINQKAFNIWKESFQAATRELQRIYGTEDLSQISQDEDS